MSNVVDIGTKKPENAAGIAAETLLEYIFTLKEADFDDEFITTQTENLVNLVVGTTGTTVISQYIE